MTGFLHLCLMILLLIIIIEDFTQRAIHWFLPPLLFILLVDLNFISNRLEIVLKESAFNSAFILFHIALAALFFSLKEKKVINLFKTHFGVGDLLFLLAISAAFSFVNFAFFNTLSLCITVSIFIFYTRYKENPNYPIPLAGLQAIMFGVVYITDILVPAFDLHDDSLILSLLTY